MIRKMAKTAALVLLLLISAATALARPRRFDGYVGGAVTGRGHSFVVGDGLNLVFRDRRHDGTRYRVCWTDRAGAARCWSRRTGARGRANSIFTAAPEGVGRYNVRWSVNQRVVARWWFYNGIGD
jgi:hypothetical protein